MLYVLIYKKKKKRRITENFHSTVIALTGSNINHFET